MSTILIRTDIDADPRTIRIATDCKCSTVTAIGALWWLWSRAQTQSHRGHLRHLTTEMIDAQTHLPGFAKACAEVGWLRIADDGAHIPDFERYFGRSAKSRAQERLKKSRQRWNKPDRPKQNGDSTGTQTGQERDECGTPARQWIGADRIGADRSGLEPTSPDRNGVAASPREAAWDRNRAVAQIAAAFPLSNGMPSPAKIRDALYRLGGSSGEARFDSESLAHAWLLQRVQLYAASERIRTTPQDKRPSMARWFAESMFDTPDVSWSSPYKHEEKPQEFTG